MKAPTVGPPHAWPFARLMAGRDPECNLDELPESLRHPAAYLASLAGEERPGAWPNVCGALGPLGVALARATLALNPDGPPPEPEDSGGPGGVRCATLADVRKAVAEVRWLWTGWLPAGRLVCLASDPGIGKTRTVLDLARRAFHQLPWPDGQAMTIPPASTTLWVAGDRQHDELAEAAAAYGLPDEAVLFNSSPDDPFGGLDLDDPEAMAALGDRVRQTAPALVVIDTVGMVTSRNLCRPEEAKAFLGPLADLAVSTGIPVLALTHLSRDKEALGRRIIGAARVVWNLTRPDPEGQPDRRRFWVSKTYALTPPPLGVTISGEGNSYDHDPPTEPAPTLGGRPPAARDKAIEFIVGKLAEGDRTQPSLIEDWLASGGGKGAFFAAKDGLAEEGRITIDTSRKPQVFHLNDSDG